MQEIEEEPQLDAVLCRRVLSGVLNPADLGTKPLPGTRIRELLYTMGALEPGGEKYGKEDKEAADERRAFSQALKAFSNSGARVNNVKALLRFVLMLSQVQSIQGLSLATASQNSDEVVQLVVTAVIGVLVVLVFWGIPYGAFRLLKWSLTLIFPRRSQVSRSTETDEEQVQHSQVRAQGVQADRGMSKGERLFSEEYVRRCTELEAQFSEKCRQEEVYWRELREARGECRRLQDAFERLRARRTPEVVHVTSSRGTRFHLPTCGHIRNSQIRTYSPCRDCIGAGG